ncbi:DsbA family protein [Prosthecomicrobium sp. N25]|uniref:DsbA family protein n=1 Tax=Prosthecomicrobium sp. N25 TaxID=3129254 RepID=UPI00307789B2
MRFAPTALLLAGALALAPLSARPAVAAEALSADQKAAVEKLVHDYILANPEIVEEALNLLEKRKADQAAAQQKQTISEKSGVLFNSARQVVLGNPKGDVTVVEFFDYNCGYCKRALGDMMALINEDKNIRFVLKEFPVLGPGSVEAAQVAAAVNRVAPQKYLDFHQTLLLGRGEANKAKALEAAASVGIDRKRVEAELSHPEIAATIEESYALANGLGLTGTPSYVVGESIVPGAIGHDRLKQRIAEARCGQTTC